MLGRPFADGYMSANISAGDSSPRCSARDANTLPAGIRSRQVSQRPAQPSRRPIRPSPHDESGPALDAAGPEPKIFMSLLEGDWNQPVGAQQARSTAEAAKSSSSCWDASSFTRSTSASKSLEVSAAVRGGGTALPMMT